MRKRRSDIFSPKMLRQFKHAGKKIGQRTRATHMLSHRKFLAVEFYMQGFNKIECCKRAGYSKSVAETQSSRIFKDPLVIQAIEDRRSRLRSRSHNMIDRIQDELAKIAFFNIGTLLVIDEDGYFHYNFDEATFDDFAALGECSISSYRDGKKQVKTIKVKPYDKKAALDSLARINGMFQDNLNVNDSGGLSLEERLLAGRKRIRKPEAIEGEYEDVTSS